MCCPLPPQLKKVELQRLSCRLQERTEACSALSARLREGRKEGEAREAKLRTAAEEEREKQRRADHQKMVTSLTKLQEESDVRRLRELYEQQQRLGREREAAIGKAEAQFGGKLAEAQRQLQVRTRKGEGGGREVERKGGSGNKLG